MRVLLPLPEVMNRVKPTALSLLVAVFLAPSSQAALYVNLPAPAPQGATGSSGYTLYLAGVIGGNPSGASFVDPQYAATGYNYPPAPQLVDTTPLPASAASATQLIWLDVMSNKSFSLSGTQKLVVTLLVGQNNVNQVIPIRAAGVTGDGAPTPCGATNCMFGATPAGTDARYFAANYPNPGGNVRIGFNPADITVTGASGGITAGNSSGTPATQTLYALVDIVNSTDTAPPFAPSANGESINFNITLSDQPPTLGACPTAPDQFYFPGDQSIKLHTLNFYPSATVGAPLANLVVLGAPNNTAPASDPTGFAPPTTIRAYLKTDGTDQYVDGFPNTTDGSDNTYGVTVFAENQSGIVSNTACTMTGVQAQPISGVLTKSRCFIATAAFHDGDAPPVRMLRHFRDEILAQSKIGQWFIENYYQVSPPLAEWAWDKPLIRSVALHFLAPIEIAAWSVLKLAHGEEVVPKESDYQPYIERLKKNGTLSPQATPSYTEELKKQIAPAAPTTGSYSEDLKKQLSQVPDSTDYSAKQKETMPPAKERESTIKLVKEHRDKLGLPELPPPHEILGMKIGISPGIKVNGGGQSFDDVYGDSWAPDVMLHYERELFHSENWGSLGIGGDIGIGYAAGFGRLTYDFPRGSGNYKSETHFNLLQFPIILDAYYRFNLFRILRPFVGAGVGVVGYDEFRDDGLPSHTGFSTVFTASAGAALLLDFFDPDTHREAYLHEGIQHVFLMGEFLTMNSFASPASISRAGVYGGFLFEY